MATIRNDSPRAVAIVGLRIEPGAVLTVTEAKLEELLGYRPFRTRLDTAELVVEDAGGVVLPAPESPDEATQRGVLEAFKAARRNGWKPGAGEALTSDELKRRDLARFWATRRHWTGDWARAARREAA